MYAALAAIVSAPRKRRLRRDAKLGGGLSNASLVIRANWERFE